MITDQGYAYGPLCAHTHTHITNLDPQCKLECVCVWADENCFFSFQTCHNSAALWELWGTQKMSIEFIQRLYGVFTGTVHRHGPIDPVGKKDKPCFISLVFCFFYLNLQLNQREKHSMQFSLTWRVCCDGLDDGLFPHTDVIIFQNEFLLQCFRYKRGRIFLPQWGAPTVISK